MEKEKLTRILNDFKKNKLDVKQILEKLKHMPFEDLGFAKIDHHRALRNGFPEVVYCQGKTIEQIIKIFQSLEKNNDNILLTRVDEKIFKKLKKLNKKINYNKMAKTIVLETKKTKRKGDILVICAGTADIPVAEEAAITAEIMGNKVDRIYDVGVAGLHRLLANKNKIFATNAIVAVAGMEGALPSVIGGLASCPVIAVPTSIGYGMSLGGLAPLLTMINSCTPNVSVVNIDNGFSAGYIASLINQKCK